MYYIISAEKKEHQNDEEHEWKNVLSGVHPQAG
jgi:hypothetical protein